MIWGGGAVLISELWRFGLWFGQHVIVGARGRWARNRVYARVVGDAQLEDDEKGGHDDGCTDGA